MASRKKDKVIILHSGGLDSTVCLLQAIEEGYDPISLGIDYNQKHIIENQFAFAQCKKLGVQRKLINVAWDKSVRKIPLGRTVAEMKESVSPAFLEGRNIVFLSLACAEAAGVNATEVWIGVNSVDYSGYPDCRPEFIDAFINMLKYGFPNGPSIKTPLIEMSKPQIATEAYKLGIKKGDTWSCYRPKITSEGITTCNECDACVLHNHAWEEVDEKEIIFQPAFENLNLR